MGGGVPCSISGISCKSMMFGAGGGIPINNEASQDTVNFKLQMLDLT